MKHGCSSKVSRTPEAQAIIFEDLMKSYHRSRYLNSDPIQFPHRFEKSEDQEVTAFLAASFAYGAVSQIHKALDQILKPLGKYPAQALKSADFDEKFIENQVTPWKGFVYRFHREGHVLALLAVLSFILKKHGSLSSFARQFDKGPNDPFRMQNVLNGFAEGLLLLLKQNSPTHLWRGLRFLINPPSGGSACKRMALFFRWMVRKDEIDFGIWNWMSPADLIVPVDTHIARLSYYLRLRSGKLEKAPNWKMALEITGSLRKLSTTDPTRYDFALTRLGILDVCKKKYEPLVCGKCEIQTLCRFAEKSREKPVKKIVRETC